MGRREGPNAVSWRALPASNPMQRSDFFEQMGLTLSALPLAGALAAETPPHRAGARPSAASPFHQPPSR